MIYTDGIHLVSDIGIPDLHLWCEFIGISRRYFHNPRKKYHPHYDIIIGRHKALVNCMIKEGLVKPVLTRQIVEICKEVYMPYVVNVAKDRYDVHIGIGYYRNPFTSFPGQDGYSRQKEFKQLFYKRLKIDIEYKNRILALKGKVLGCFCKPGPCHGDVIIEYLKTVIT